jgi:chromosome partitioning protein
MNIAVVNSKGGSGKTTTVCLLALYWSGEGRTVAVQDTDPQGSAAAVVAKRALPALWLYDRSRPATVTLCDTRPGIERNESTTLLKWAHVVLVPFGLSPTDMRATGSTIRALGANPKVRLLFCAVDPRTAVFRDRQNYADLLGVPALSSYLPVRHCYRLALVDGLTALSAKARGELSELSREIEEEAQRG